MRRSSHSLEDEVDLLGLVRADGYRLRRSAQLFVPGLYGVGAGRQIAEIEASIFSGDREVWMFEYRNITAHPGMHVALYRDGNLLARERLFHLRVRRLGLVPLALVRGHGMNIVRSRVVIDQLQRLVGAHRQHMRLIHTSF